MTIEDFIEQAHEEEETRSMQSVLLCIQLPLNKADTDECFDAAMELEEILREIVYEERVGWVDGHELCSSPTEENITYFMYGADAEAIYNAIKKVFTYMSVLAGSYIVKRFGDTNTEDEIIKLA